MYKIAVTDLKTNTHSLIDTKGTYEEVSDTVKKLKSSVKKNQNKLYTIVR